MAKQIRKEIELRGDMFRTERYHDIQLVQQAKHRETNCSKYFFQSTFEPQIVIAVMKAEQ